MKKLIALAFIVSSSVFAFVNEAQAQKCNGYQYRCERGKDPELRYNSQSTSGLFGSDDKSELNLVVYEGQDYRVSFCMGKSLGDAVAFTIKDPETGEMLYDNSQDDYIQEFEFTSSTTRRLVLEVSVYGGEADAGGKSKFGKVTTDCIGVLVEYMPTPKIGFGPPQPGL